MSAARVASSFRDPSGFLFTREGVLHRQVQASYAPHYALLRSSGLYDALVGERLLVPHDEVDVALAAGPGAAHVLRPERIPVVSFPAEWGFGQLRAAARLTLRVQQVALAHGMVLKDASAFNVQFRGSRPVFVDTLSFERYVEGAPWVAYRQFCQHFVAPLALQAHVDIRLRDLARRYLDGIPLDLASGLLPRSSWLRPWALMHVHLHARSIARHESTRGRAGDAGRSARVSRTGLEGLVAHLRDTVEGMRWRGAATEWGDYETSLGYSATERSAKQDLVERLLRDAAPRSVVDLGANAGEYSRIARAVGASVVGVDGDPVAVERAFARFSGDGDEGVLSLWVDLANPTGACGWAHEEWPSFTDRVRSDLVMALALVHHLAIGNNVPLDAILAFLSRLGARALVEWVPKEDPQVRRLLLGRADIFDGYHEDGFRAAVERRFRIGARVPVGDSGRVLYLLAPREG